MPEYTSCCSMLCRRALSSSVTIPLGQRDLHLLQQCLEHRVPGGRGLLEPLAAGEPLADVVLQLGQGLELRGVLGEVVVELR
ncbi:hypothetical protein [Nocardioides anomalus]|uniref:hypothetical protein n=1 Tax=Nocardioides anomalus TaxID=2712223 RepID=UPI002E788F8E|nr:hypothetical protein [Nocardioides anomalus]